jgi:hypothetical protein
MKIIKRTPAPNQDYDVTLEGGLVGSSEHTAVTDASCIIMRARPPRDPAYLPQFKTLVREWNRQRGHTVPRLAVRRLRG